MGLGSGIERSLIATLENALAGLEDGHSKASANPIRAFIKEVGALAGKKLSEAEAAQLTERAHDSLAASVGAMHCRAWLNGNPLAAAKPARSTLERAGDAMTKSFIRST